MDGDELKVRLLAITERLLPHIGMLLLLPSRDAGPGDVICNGTASFVDTGSEKLLVTCGHVMDEFNKLRANNSHAVLAVASGSGARPLIVSGVEVVANGGERLDLAVLRLPNPDRITGNGKSYFRADVWPPKLAAEGQRAFILGFPARTANQATVGWRCGRP